MDREDIVYHMAGIDEYTLSEHRLKIVVGETGRELICTRSDLRELVYGYLISEGIIASAEEVISIYLKDDESVASVSVSEIPAGDSKEAGSTPFFVPFDPDMISDMSACFLASGTLHNKTSATHLAALAKDGEFLCVFEDISRHCAIDKAIGYGACAGIDMSNAMLFTSGRVQEDTVRKLLNSGIPVLISKATATKQAIDLARENNMTLIGRARGDSPLACYNCTVPTDLDQDQNSRPLSD